MEYQALPGSGFVRKSPEKYVLERRVFSRVKYAASPGIDRREFNLALPCTPLSVEPRRVDSVNEESYLQNRTVEDCRTYIK